MGAPFVVLAEYIPKCDFEFAYRYQIGEPERITEENVFAVQVVVAGEDEHPAARAGSRCRCRHTATWAMT